MSWSERDNARFRELKPTVGIPQARRIVKAERKKELLSFILEASFKSYELDGVYITLEEATHLREIAEEL